MKLSVPFTSVPLNLGRIGRRMVQPSRPSTKKGLSTVRIMAFIVSFLWLTDRITAADKASTVSWSSDKPLVTVVPGQDLVTLTVHLGAPPLQLESASASPKTGPLYRVQLIAPKTHPLVTTDFPHVEGSTLVDTVVHVPTGVYSFKQVFPIRGDYTLRIAPYGSSLEGSQPGAPGFPESAPSTAGDLPRSSSEFTFTVGENPAKVRTLGLFLFGLVLIGAVSGYIIARGHLSQMALSTVGVVSVLIALAGQGWGLFLPVLTATWGEDARAHGGGHKKAPSVEQESAGPQGVSPGSRSPGESPSPWVLSLAKIPETPKVGELMTLTGELKAHDAKAEVPTAYRIQIVQAEHDQVVYATELFAPDGLLKWRGSFFDGSAHRIIVEALPKDSASSAPPLLSASTEVDVEALEPTVGSIVKSLTLMMLVAGIGLLGGLWAGFASAPRLLSAESLSPGGR